MADGYVTSTQMVHLYFLSVYTSTLAGVSILKGIPSCLYEYQGSNLTPGHNNIFPRLRFTLGHNILLGR